MALVSKKGIRSALIDLPGWTYEDKALHKDFNFDTYMEGINFVKSLAQIAEKHNHHPDLRVGWCKVRVTFTAHDQGGVTEQCIAMVSGAESLSHQ